MLSGISERTMEYWMNYLLVKKFIYLPPFPKSISTLTYVFLQRVTYKAKEKNISTCGNQASNEGQSNIMG